MFNKLKQISDLRTKAKQLQEQLSQIHVEGSAGWGKVKIQFNGTQQAISCTIDPDLMTEKNKLEGLICEAINDGMQKLQKTMAEKMKTMEGFGDIAGEFGDLLKS
jgi:DNA-binding YbaB/EbfC family protein